jgi:hypothetical protein
VAFGVPSISLIDQTFERFVENGIDPVEMGVIQGDHVWTRPHAPIQICSAQTLARRGLPDVDVAVIDEAHLRFEVYDRWMTESGYGPKPMSVEDREALGRQHRVQALVGRQAENTHQHQGHQHPEPIDPYNIKLLHYTLGGPWHGYEPDGGHLWNRALRDLLVGRNPCADMVVYPAETGVLRFSGRYQRREP